MEENIKSATNSHTPWKHANHCASLCFFSIFLSQTFRMLILEKDKHNTEAVDIIYGYLIIALITALIYGIFAWCATILFRKGTNYMWYLLELMLLWIWPMIISIGLMLIIIRQ
ncbi:MAG TPA: hypothetical protein DCL76_07235 [Chloroflexi bacterium]|nr:hypothetical protein [Chloroflexota bacterium]HCU98907.1 hypothetical protein [Chloroflexota bacterium]|tara:strand:- start:74 stop:412 length:339 start_codon:yes stop_codon:yes gene_type:complete